MCLVPAGPPGQYLYNTMLSRLVISEGKLKPVGHRLMSAPKLLVGTNLLLGPPEKFYRRNPSGTFRDVHWYLLGDPKKVPGAPSQGFLIFLAFDKNITKIQIWLSYPHFWANF